MASAVIDLDMLKRVILAEVTREAVQPTQLLARLGDQYPDSAIKDAILRLLQEHSIEMTPELRLQVSKAA